MARLLPQYYKVTRLAMHVLYSPPSSLFTMYSTAIFPNADTQCSLLAWGVGLAFWDVRERGSGAVGMCAYHLYSTACVDKVCDGIFQRPQSTTVDVVARGDPR